MTELNLPLEILPFFLLVAYIYSSVGHGGASGYLALFALFGITSPQIAPIALSLNIIVASTGFIMYRKAGYFNVKLLFPFIISSIPAAFIGGWVNISDHTFSILLGIALMAAALRIFLIGEVRKKISVNEKTIWTWGIVIGAILGFVSGMIGIGGGIFLSPIILFLGWADIKQTAAVSSAFIVLNSVSGLTGHIVRGNVVIEPLVILATIVLVGGFIGSYMGSKRIRYRRLQLMLGIVLVVASLKVFL